jgi:hypothetical protein
MGNWFRTSKKALVILAAAVWYIGAVMLFRGSLHLVAQSRQMRPDSAWHWLFIVLGAILGVVQSQTIFARSCRKNIQRIRELEDPRLWNFYRTGFFIALAGMISAGILLDILSQGNYFFMLFVAGVDIALTISLLGSSYLFWTGYMAFNDEP